MYSRSEFDELVRKKCGRLTPQQVARTGYTRMSDYEKAYDSLYRDVEIQEKFGVRELAFSRASPFEKLHSGRHIGSGEGALSDTIKTYVPKIAEVKHRQIMFDDEGKPIDPDVQEDLRQELADARRRIEMLEQVERPVLVEREREALEEAEEAREETVEERFKRRLQTQMRAGDLKDMYADFLNANFPSRAERSQIGLLSVTNFMKLPQDARLDYLIENLGSAENVAIMFGEPGTVERLVQEPEPEPQTELEEEEEYDEQPDID